MDKIVLTGGNPLQGEVQISGSKNAALPLMAAALLARSPSQLQNVPRLRDIHTMGRMLENLGARVQDDAEGKLQIDPSTLKETEAPYDLVRQMRASIYVLGPLLARFGRARVSLPGGCAIGSRPIDLHLRGLEALGAKITLEHGYVEATAPDSGKLQGAEITLSGPNGSSVGASCNVLMAACLARGRSLLSGLAREPHVEDLIGFLQAMGARIEQTQPGVVEVEGVESLQGANYTVIPDTIEAGTYMVAAALTSGDVTLSQCNPQHMQTEILNLRRMGAEIEELDEQGCLRVQCDTALLPVNIETAPYPGFATDMQAQFMVAMALAEGESSISETIYPDRFLHAAELSRMGANIQLTAGKATIRGVEKLSGATVMASDLRASAALILAGLAAEGRTEVLRVYHLDRGYEKFVEKFRALGANIKREKNA